MRTGWMSAAALLACIALILPDNALAKQNGSRGSAGMSSRTMTPRAPLNPPRFQPVKAGPLAGPARPPAGFRDRSIPQAALPQRIHRHSFRHARGLPIRGLAPYGGYVGGPYVLYADNSEGYDAEEAPISRRPYYGICSTERVQVSRDRSRDVNVTRCY
jgi:hypothetical protein